MVLEWFAGAREDGIDGLVRRKRYGRAIKLLRGELERRRGDRRLRLRLGEVLLAAGERVEGVKTLSKVADDLAAAGQVAQAIAVLKKIDGLEPGREDVEDKLAYLVQRQAGREFDPWSRSRAALQETGSGAAASAGEQAAEGFEIGIEPLLREEREPPVPAGGVASPAAVAESVEATAPSPGGPEGAEDVASEAFRDELVALLEETLSAAGLDAAGTPPDPVPPAVDTPLFRSLTRDELVALMRGLRLLAFEAGQIIVSEGEAGGSLFVVTRGSVRAYVRNTAQEQVQVRRLKEGDFFGEISVLSGQPRSATITAASRCELLELDKPTFDRIATTHPHLRQVLQEFHDQRKDSTLETLSRAMRLPGR